MVRKIYVNVSNNPAAREYHISGLAKDLKNPIILCPGVKPLGVSNSKVIYTKDFSEDGLLKILGRKTANDMIVQDVQKMSTKTIDGIIKFATSASLNLYFVGAPYNGNGGVYPAIDYLANMSLDINQLEEFVVAKELTIKKVADDKTITAAGLLAQATELHDRISKLINTARGRKIEKTK